MTETSAPARPSVGLALGILVALVPVLGILYYLLSLSGFGHVVFMGFFFMFYWTGILNRDASQYLPSLVGGLGGIAIGWLLLGSSDLFGQAGPIAAIVLIFATIYAAIRGHVPMLVNNGMFLYMTLATVPQLNVKDNVLPMAGALTVGALYVGLLFLVLLPKLTAKRSPASKVATSPV